MTVMTTTRTEPFVPSLDWTDAYKRAMNGFIHTYFPVTRVRFSFHYRNNTPHKLVDLVDETTLRNDLEALRELKFTDGEIEATVKEFSPLQPNFGSDSYRYFLKHFQLPPITVKRIGDTYAIETEGYWAEASWWETFDLGAVARRAGETLARRMYGEKNIAEVWRQNDRAVRAKTALLKQYPEIRFIEFGTRRAWSPEIHELNIGYLADELSPTQLVGTSNIYLARQLGIPHGGTQAHELGMVMGALVDGRGGDDSAIRRSQMQMFDYWDEFFFPHSGDKQLVALNDTHGTDAFYEDFGAERARRWRAVRPDSGDPVVEGEKAIAFWQRHGIDPTTKTVFFADGQTVESMIRIHEHFRGRTQCLFGPGTSMTNDVGLPTLSIVMKATHVFVNGKWVPTVKLSNNLKKATGPAEYVERYKRIFGYDSTFSQECRY